MPELEQLRGALIKLDEVGAGLSTTTDAPIFVAGTLWRCGSTLLQRIIMSDPRVLIWGEPIEDRAIVDRFAEILSTPGLTKPFWVGNKVLSDLQTKPHHLLWPDAADLKAGMRAMFDTWLGAPARRRGFEEWGLKEVRWSGSDILLLRWLYPNSRVFLIVRDPVESYRSLLKYYYSENHGYYIRWPDHRIFSAQSYANYWSQMVLSYIELGGVEAYTLIQYRDLVDGRVDIPALGSANGLKLDATLALSARVNTGILRKPLPAADEAEILKITEGAREQLNDYISSFGRPD